MTRSESGPPGSTPAAPPAGDLEPCALCGGPVAARALFCHACGAIQPPRPLDPFARLGLERRFDLDPERLAKQHAGFARVLSPDRFAARSPAEQDSAKAHVRALDAALDTLRDPIRRAHALLALVSPGPLAVRIDPDPSDPDLSDSGDDSRELAVSLAVAVATSAGGDRSAVDRIARDLDRRIEACLTYLAPAFRKAQEDPAKAGAVLRILVRLERLTRMATEAAAHRSP